MSQVRKRNNMQLRLQRSCRALLKTNHAAVANVSPPDRQIMIDWLHCRQIRSRPVANALCDIPHRWTVYIAVFCQEPSGAQYSKATEFTTAGMHLVASLEQLMIEKHAELCVSANQKHVIGSGWIAIPDQMTLTEAQANAVFTAMGVWQRASAA